MKNSCKLAVSPVVLWHRYARLDPDPHARRPLLLPPTGAHRRRSPRRSVSLAFTPLPPPSSPLALPLVQNRLCAEPAPELASALRSDTPLRPRRLLPLVAITHAVSYASMCSMFHVLCFLSFLTDARGLGLSRSSALLLYTITPMYMRARACVCVFMYTYTCMCVCARQRSNRRSGKPSLGFLLPLSVSPSSMTTRKKLRNNVYSIMHGSTERGLRLSIGNVR